MIKSYALYLTVERSSVDWLENIAKLFHVHSLSYQPSGKEHWPYETDSLPEQGLIQGSLFFEGPENRDQMAQFLKTQNIDCQKIDQDIAPWQEYHQQFMKPFNCGALTIVPNAPPEKREKNTLYFPAGLGFGTGHHETTQSCLELLQTLDLKDKTFLDFGSGSGILSVASLLLGAKKAFYLDIDPQALQATQQNLLAHGLCSDSQILETLNTDQTFDFILANILCEPLIENQELLARSLTAQADLILSGVLSEQADMLEEAYDKNFELVKKIQKGQWLGYHFKLK